MSQVTPFSGEWDGEAEGEKRKQRKNEKKEVGPGLAFETWDPPSRGSLLPDLN